MGQHFLSVKRVAERIVSFADISCGEKILEVGGGHGILTGILVDSGAEVTCIEKDSMLASELKLRFPEVKVVEGDALSVPWGSFDRFVSNIPYSISTDLTLKLIGCSFKKSVVMYQEDFARRLVSQQGSKDYSRLGIKVQYGHRLEFGFRVPKSAFFPPPKVDSAVVSLEPQECPLDLDNEDIFFKVVDALFSHRRKKAKNNILSFFNSYGKEDAILDILEEWPHSDSRVETISMKDMAVLANMISLRI